MPHGGRAIHSALLWTEASVATIEQGVLHERAMLYAA